jgi:hypothetical protein
LNQEVRVRSTKATTSSSLLRDNVVVRLAGYYAVVLLIFLGLGVLFPSIVDYMDLERLRVVTSTQDLFGAAGSEGGPSLYTTEALFRVERIVPVLVSMFGALALSIPVAWVYTWTSSQPKTRQAVARTLVVLPIAIAFVVFLVKGSLPLAFSLAGIVAAVRFRTSLSDVTDAVFLFVVIGIGLSAGTQLLSVAFLASVLFTGATLAVWGTRFAEDPPQLEGLRLVRAGSALPNGSTGARRGRKGPGAGGEAPQTVFLVQTSDPGQAERLANLAFGQYAKEWRLSRVTESDDGGRLLEFHVRLKKRHGPATVIDAIRDAGGSVILNVESASG